VHRELQQVVLPRTAEDVHLPGCHHGLSDVLLLIELPPGRPGTRSTERLDIPERRGKTVASARQRRSARPERSCQDKGPRPGWWSHQRSAALASWPVSAPRGPDWGSRSCPRSGNGRRPGWI
jgi:hypothetical protein